MSRKIIIATKPSKPDVRQHDGPREEERDLEVEQDEEDRDEVVADVEFHPRVLERLEAALVGGELFGIGPVRREERADATGAGTPSPRPTMMKRRMGKYCSSIVGGLLGLHLQAYTVVRLARQPCKRALPSRAMTGRRRTHCRAKTSSILVPTGRLELPRLSPLPPQDSVSTNFTTSAFQGSEVRYQGSEEPAASASARACRLFLIPDT